MARYRLIYRTQLKQEAETLAAQQGVSLNQFILWAVAEKVARSDSKLDDPAFPQITYEHGQPASLHQLSAARAFKSALGCDEPTVGVVGRPDRGRV